MSQENIMPRLNQKILDSSESKVFINYLFIERSSQYWWVILFIYWWLFIFVLSSLIDHFRIIIFDFPFLSFDPKVLNMAGDQLNSLKMSSFSRLDKRSMSATMVKNLFYITGKEGSKVSSHFTEWWVFLDLSH